MRCVESHAPSFPRKRESSSFRHNADPRLHGGDDQLGLSFHWMGRRPMTARGKIRSACATVSTLITRWGSLAHSPSICSI